jgi:hypothetical protein
MGKGYKLRLHVWCFIGLLLVTWSQSARFPVMLLVWRWRFSMTPIPTVPLNNQHSFFWCKTLTLPKEDTHIY